MQKYKTIPKMEEDEEESLEENITNSCIIDKEDYKEYILFLDENLTNEKEYRKFYTICEIAEEEDVIKLVVNCCGGKLGILSQLMNCILNTRATTIAEIYVAYSAASFLVLLCDEIKPMRFSVMMLHSVRSEITGSIFDMRNEMNSLEKRSNNITNNVVKRFLSKKEIKRVLGGEELWFDENEIKERLEDWVPYRERK